jgi:hypothetical protein
LTEDNWEEELNKMPLFMKEMRPEDVEGNVALQALQSLAYEGTPEGSY